MSAQSRDRWGVAIIRIVVGVIMVAHGFQKVFVFGMAGVTGFMAQAGLPWPMASAVAATSAELLGGLALILGLYTRRAAIPVAFTMLVAMMSVHLANGFFLPDGIEYTLTLFVTATGVALAGPGALAVDNWRTSDRRAPNHQQSGSERAA